MDFVSDQSCRHLNRINNLVEMPDFVKKSSVDPEDTAKLANHQFANPAKREFPIDEPGHVVLSYAYLKSADIAQPEVEQRVKRAAVLFGVTAELDRVDTAFGALNKQASAVEKRYALEVDFTGAPEHLKVAGVKNFYPINTDLEIEDSGRKVCNDRNRMPEEMFVEACRNIVKAAKAMKLERRQLPVTVWNVGDEFSVDLSHVSHHAEKRASITGDSTYRDIVTAAVDDNETDTDKYVELWRQLDRQHDIEKMDGLKSAHEIFYSGVSQDEVEAELENFILLDGTPTAKAAFASIPEDKIHKLFPASSKEKLTTLVKRAKTESGSMLGPDISNLDQATQKSLLRLALQHA